MTRTLQIDLRLSDFARAFEHFHAGPRSGNFARKCLILLSQHRIGRDRQAQPMA